MKQKKRLYEQCQLVYLELDVEEFNAKTPNKPILVVYLTSVSHARQELRTTVELHEGL